MTDRIQLIFIGGSEFENNEDAVELAGCSEDVGPQSQKGNLSGKATCPLTNFEIDIENGWCAKTKCPHHANYRV